VLTAGVPPLRAGLLVRGDDQSLARGARRHRRPAPKEKKKKEASLARLVGGVRLAGSGVGVSRNSRSGPLAGLG